MRLAAAVLHDSPNLEEPIIGSFRFFEPNVRIAAWGMPVDGPQYRLLRRDAGTFVAKPLEVAEVAAIVGEPFRLDADDVLADVVAEGVPPPAPSMIGERFGDGRFGD